MIGVTLAAEEAARWVALYQHDMRGAWEEQEEAQAATVEAWLDGEAGRISDGAAGPGCLAPHPTCCHELTTVWELPPHADFASGDCLLSELCVASYWSSPDMVVQLIPLAPREMLWRRGSRGAGGSGAAQPSSVSRSGGEQLRSYLTPRPGVAVDAGFPPAMPAALHLAHAPRKRPGRLDFLEHSEAGEDHHSGLMALVRDVLPGGAS